MSLFSWIVRRFWLCLGLMLILAGSLASTVGYLAAREARTRSVIVAVQTSPPPRINQPTTRKTGAVPSAAASAASAKKGAKVPTTTTANKSALPQARKPLVAAAPKPPAIVTATPRAVSKWRGVMWWGGGALVIGVASVAYSLHELRPKKPTTGAEELLNDAPPF